jgi:sensor histidine kinase regulating citrate/malate metabolism
MRLRMWIMKVIQRANEMTQTATHPAEMTINRFDVMANIVTINALNSKIEAQDAELVRLRAENAAMAKQLKRARNYAAAVSQPNAYGVGR